MARPTSPRPFRLAAAVLLVAGAALALAVLRLPAAPGPAAPDTPPAPRPAEPSPREALRYDGKSFDQWRQQLQTELKPAVRADGMKALGAFGANGYGAEATRVLLALMRAHDVAQWAPENKAVVDAARAALAQIGDPALPVLREGIKDKERNVRRFAAEGLAAKADWAGAAVPELLDATHDPDVYVRWTAVEALGLVKPPPPGYLAALLERLKDPDPNPDSDVRNAAVLNVGRLGPAARAATPLLVGLLDKGSDRIRWHVMEALVKIKAGPAEAVPALVRVLREPSWGLEGVAARALRSFGPAAAPAVPALVTALQRRAKALDWQAEALIQALGRVGPAARPAVPLLKELRYSYAGPNDPVSVALRQIEK